MADWEEKHITETEALRRKIDYQKKNMELNFQERF